jgi:hypothetical protein
MTRRKHDAELKILSEWNEEAAEETRFERRSCEIPTPNICGAGTPARDFR